MDSKISVSFCTSGCSGFFAHGLITGGECVYRSGNPPGRYIFVFMGPVGGQKIHWTH